MIPPTGFRGGFLNLSTSMGKIACQVIQAVTKLYIPYLGMSPLQPLKGSLTSQSQKRVTIAELKKDWVNWNLSETSSPKGAKMKRTEKYAP